MISNLTALALDELNSEDVSALPISSLLQLQKEVNEAMELWERRKVKLQDGLHSKYGDKATAERHANGKDTGSVVLKEDGLSVKCDLSKRVKWDQEVLTSIRTRIVAAGQNPDIYMQPEYKIKEAAYWTWPPNERMEFDKGRTVTADKPKYTIVPPKA